MTGCSTGHGVDGGIENGADEHEARVVDDGGVNEG